MRSDPSLPPAARRPTVRLFCLLLTTLLLGGCSYHENRLSYFDMLDPEKRTPRNREAAATFWSSVRPISTLSAAHYKLGRHYQQQGKFSKAIAEFSKALQTDSNYCQAYNGLGMSHDALRQCEPAYLAYQQGLQCAPGEAYLYNNYGCSSLLCGDYEQGLALLLKAAELSDQNRRIRNNLALARLAAGREQEPLQQLWPDHDLLAQPARTALPQTAEQMTEQLAGQTAGQTAERVVEQITEQVAEQVAEVPLTDRGAPPPAAAEPRQAALASAAAPTPVTPIAPPEPQRQLAAAIRPDDGGTAVLISRLLTVETKKVAAPSGLTAAPAPTQETVAARLVADRAKRMALAASSGGAGGARPAQEARLARLVADSTKKIAAGFATGAVEVSNGNGVAGMAGRSAEYLRARGFTVRRLTNAPHFGFHDSVIYYREGYLELARELARVIPGAQELEKVDSLGRATIGVRLLLGQDLVGMRFPEGYGDLFAESTNDQPAVASLSLVN